MEILFLTISPQFVRGNWLAGDKENIRGLLIEKGANIWELVMSSVKAGPPMGPVSNAAV